MRPNIFLTDWSAPLDEILCNHPRYDSPEVHVFTEFLGPNSFAGKHRSDDPKRCLVLFDVATAAGIIEPEALIGDFASLPVARVVYRGKLTGKFIHDLREGRYGVAEGVVCKGVEDGNVWMAKIKTYAYLERLKQAFKDDWETYWE